jgi:hypothetical protein
VILAILGMVSAIPALAGELPGRPEPPELLATDCAAPMVLTPGKPPPPGLVDDAGLVTCGGQLLPTAAFLHYRNLAAWGDAVADLYAIDAAVAAFKLEQSQARAAELAELLAEPEPLLDRPAVNRTIGAVSMLGAVGVGILVVRAGTEAQPAGR